MYLMCCHCSSKEDGSGLLAVSAGAFRNIGRDRIADDIVKTMRAAGFDIRESDPFENTSNIILPFRREQSPYVNRIRLMWQQMREQIVNQFPVAPGSASDIAAYLKWQTILMYRRLSLVVH